MDGTPSVTIVSYQLLKVKYDTPHRGAAFHQFIDGGMHVLVNKRKTPPPTPPLYRIHKVEYKCTFVTSTKLSELREVCSPLPVEVVKW